MRQLSSAVSSAVSSAALVAVISLAASAFATDAWAGPFGGFAHDEQRYLVDRATVCLPVAVPKDFAETSGGSALAVSPRCESVDRATVSSWKFRRTPAQRGTDKAFSASARSRRLTVHTHGAGAAQSGTLVIWEATDPIARVVAVYASPGKRLVAVEYEVRFGGRLRVEVVAFAVPVAAAPEPGPGGDPGPATRPATGPAVGPATGPTIGQTAPKVGASAAVPALPAAATKALKKARRAAKGKRHKAAYRAYQQVLAADAEHAEARFGVARALAGQKKRQEAVRELQTLAASTRPDAIVWLVEARFDRTFASLRADADFRAAVGYDKKAGQTRHIYDRLVGFSNEWEQPETTCENAEVGLKLDRQKRTFRLRITTRCGGYKDTTRLRGRWQIAANGQVLLVLPNKKAKDETVACAMQVCSGEDCMRCLLDADLDFVLKPVRR